MADPEIEDWVVALGKEGREGGCGAVEERRGSDTAKSEVGGCYPIGGEWADIGEDLCSYQDMVEFFKLAKNNRAVPQGRVIKELYTHIFEHVSVVGRLIVSILNRLFAAGRVPCRWQESQTAQLDKNNGKVGTKRVRLINMLCPMGKAYFKIVWDEATLTKHDFAYGFYARRRREQAILMQNVVTWKLRRASQVDHKNKTKYGHITTLRDVANVFPNPKFSKLDKMVDRVMGEHSASVKKL